MAEPEKDQIGDGQDNFGQAAGKAIQAAKQISHDAAAEAAVKGAEATANAAAAVVQAGAESGKAVAEIAAGTAAGGPWGAILSAAWAMRHSLFKVLVCICLFLLIIVILICSIPSIVLDSVFGLNGVPPAEEVTLESSYSEMSNAVSAVIDAGYDQSLARVEEIILDMGHGHTRYAPNLCCEKNSDGTHKDAGWKYGISKQRNTAGRNYLPAVSQYRAE